MNDPRACHRRRLSWLLLLGGAAACDSDRASVPPAGPADTEAVPGCAAVEVTRDLFISEYVEGSSNNKAIELYNGTGSSIDLTPYRLQFYFNGSSTAGTTIDLQGTVSAGETFVVTDNDATAELLALADQTSTANFYNGNDAVVLLREDVILDVIGQVGFDPGREWPSPDGGTENNTLRRRASVQAGDMDGGDAFDPSLEWEGLGVDAFGDLGHHAVEGDGGTDSTGEDSGSGADDATGSEVSSTGGPAALELLIHEIQGPGEHSPWQGSAVIVEAVVVAQWQSTSGLSGFFLQEEDTDVDGDPATSEGLFVFASSPAVQVGDRVRVAGTVTEYFDLTELNEVTAITVLGQAPLPTPTPVTLPWSSPVAREALEGMSIVTTQPLSVTDNYNLGRFGQVLLSHGDRLLQPTQVAQPGATALAVQQANALDQILLDDLSNAQNPDPVIYPAPGLSPATSLRAGTTVAPLHGVLDYSFDAYKIRPTEPPVFDLAASPRPAPVPRTGDLRVASFNVLNFFNGNGLGGGFPTSRGADSPEEFERQSAKIVTAVLGLDADIIGLLEIENDGYGPQSAIADLVDRLNEASAPASPYAFVDPGVAALGTDEIAVGLLYRPAQVALVGDAAILDAGVDPRFRDDRNRPTLAQAFEHTPSGERVTVAVNHFKSKGSSCNDVGDPDAGDGQGNCNVTRTQAAAALIDWLATDPTGSDDPDHLILGDLNAYAMEDPITTLEASGYVNLAASGHGYGFEGQWGTLDYAMANPAFASRLTLATHWNINADEPRVFDYNVEFKSAGQIDGWYEPSAYRASDHDPVVADFGLAQKSPTNLPPTVEFVLPLGGLPGRGAHELQARARDAAGQSSAVASRIIQH